jgi:cell division protein FtsB
MRAAKAEKPKSKKSLILRLALIAFVAYIAVTLIHMQLQISRSETSLADVNAKLHQQQSTNAEIDRVLAQDDGTYKESIARDKLGYAKPNEHVYINASGD